MTTLHYREHRQVRELRRHEGTVRFFVNHPFLIQRPRTRTVAVRAVRRAHVWVRVLRRELAETRAQLRPQPRSVQAVVCAVFGGECGKALSVAWCESRYSTTATNGQYFGLFQMGEHERATYGGSTLDPWDQCRAAHAYYRVAGWTPWTCA